MDWWGYAIGGLGTLAVFAWLRRRGLAASALDTSRGQGHAPIWWTPDDYRAHAAASARLGINPADWGAVYRSESGFNPAAAFPKLDSEGHPLAVGIGQLTSAANGAAGITEATRAGIPSMPVSAQIPIFERAMRTSLGGMKPPSAGALYAFNFLPARVKARGMGPDVVLGTTDEFPLDVGLDSNGDGNYTISDLSARLSRYKTDALYLGWLQGLRDATGDQSISPTW